MNKNIAVKVIILYNKAVILVLFIPLVISLFHQKAHSVGFGIGVQGYYTKWYPCWRNLYEDFEIEPLLLYGPILSFTLDRFQLSFIMSTNTFPMEVLSESNATIKETGSLGDYYVSAELKAERTEIDATLSYKITDKINLFGGYKIMNFRVSNKFDLDRNNASVSSPYTLTSTSDVPIGIHMINQGFGFGLNYTHSLYRSLYLTGSASLIVVQTTIHELLYTEESSPGIIEITDTNSTEYKYTGYGTSISLSISHFINSISTSLVLGGRLQTMGYDAHSSAPELTADFMYGIFASAMFYF